MLDAVRTAGWLLGAVAALTDGRYEGKVLAMTDCVLRPLAKDAFDQALHTISVSRWLNDLLASDVRAQMRRTTAIAERSLPMTLEVLFSELLAAAGRVRADGAIRLDLQLSVTAVSKLVGASREHTSRSLGELDATGTVVRRGGWFVAPRGSPLANARVISRAAVKQGHM